MLKNLNHELGYFDPDEPIDDLSGNLPHWRQGERTYFVTFRLADSLPTKTLDLWRRERTDWLLRRPPPHSAAQRQEFYELFVLRFQRSRCRLGPFPGDAISPSRMGYHAESCSRRRDAASRV